MFYPTRFGQGASNSDLHSRYATEIEGLDEHTAKIFIEAAEGEVELSQLNTPQDAEWARNGYEHRASNEDLPLHERRHAYEMIEAIDCDFGEGPRDIWSAQDEVEAW